jgi:CRISPR-associated exonuclease Cas4
MTPIIEALAGAAGVLLLVGALLGLLGRRARRRAGVPGGRISYSDIGATSDDGQRSPVLVARTIALRGRPDVLVERRGALIPVEIKTGRAPTRPYEGHMLQALAYCLLVEETRGVRPRIASSATPAANSRSPIPPMRKHGCDVWPRI